MIQDPQDLLRSLEASIKPKLLIVGFYHFANPGLDVVKVGLDDHLAPGRQKQIEDLVARLAQFKPTKITVEAPFGSPTTTDAYRAWLKGERELKVNETEQVGFRLARLSGHDQLWPIDYKSDMDFDTFTKFLEAKNPALLKEMGRAFETMGKVMAGTKDRTVLENLRLLNDPEADRIGNGLYLRFLGAVDGADHPGADLVAGWWKRNLVWLSHLTTVAQDPSDRVVVLCGAGHASVLRSLLRDSIDFEVVPFKTFLK